MCFTLHVFTSFLTGPFVLGPQNHSVVCLEILSYFSVKVFDVTHRPTSALLTTILRELIQTGYCTLSGYTPNVCGEIISVKVTRKNANHCTKRTSGNITTRS